MGAQPEKQSAIQRIHKEYPMSLGVLNNLSAMYAENNLNNTNNSLNTVLQQLSSGSKINSGADDAAGLSLVNGLQANSAGPDPVADQRPGRCRPSAGRRWRPLASDKPAQPGRDAGYRSLERHPQQPPRTRPPTRNISRSCPKSTTSAQPPRTTSRPSSAHGTGTSTPATLRRPAPRSTI